METIYLSKCCRKEAVADYNEVTKKTIYTCLKCEKECEAEEVCAECWGEGEVTTMEEAHPGEPQTLAPIGTAPCPMCRPQHEEDDMDDDSGDF